MSSPSNYRRINGFSLSKFLQNHPPFDLILFLPSNSKPTETSFFLQNILELKASRSPTAHFLIVAIHETSETIDSALFLSWKSLQDTLSTSLKGGITLFEVCFKKIPSRSLLYQAFFQWIKKIPFSQGMICGSNQSLPEAAQLKQLFESGISQKTDLNLGAYTVPFYKGFLINFWATPLAYMLGRSLRNPAPSDLLFSKECSEFWLTLRWPLMESLFSTHLFLTLNSLHSGLRIREIFLGRAKSIGDYLKDEIPEAIHIGLLLLKEHRTFLWNSTALISPKHPTPNSIPFKMYSVSDLNEVFLPYPIVGTILTKLKLRSIQSFFCDEFANTVLPYLKFPAASGGESSNRKEEGLPTGPITPKTAGNAANGFKKSVENRKTPVADIPPWNQMLPFIVHSFFAQPSGKTKEFEKILCDLLFLKAAHWPEEIRTLIHATQQKAIQDQIRGFPWVGGEEGQLWHLHDEFEKKLHNDYTQLHDSKRKYL